MIAKLLIGAFVHQLPRHTIEAFRFAKAEADYFALRRLMDSGILLAQSPPACGCATNQFHFTTSLYYLHYNRSRSCDSGKGRDLRDKPPPHRKP